MSKLKIIVAAVCFCIVACIHRKDLLDGERDNSSNKTEAPVNKKDDADKEEPYKFPAASMNDLSQVKDDNVLIAQAWEAQEDNDYLGDATEDSKVRLTFRGLYLASDHSFVKDPRGTISFGIWSYDDAAKKLTFKYNQGRTELVHVHGLRPQELSLTGADSKPIKYIAAGMNYKVKEEDPFYIGNNQWRIKPGKPENDEAVRARLKGCINFFILFYKDVVIKNASVVSFYGFPNCLKFYGPGIFMRKKSELDENWTNCFYNEEQSLKAYDMMDAVFSKKYTWPKENIGWLKKNEAMLEQMYKNL